MSSRRLLGSNGIFLRTGSFGIQTAKPNSGEGTSRQEAGRAGRVNLSLSVSGRGIDGALASAGCGSFKNLNEPKKSSTFFESSCFDSSSPCAHTANSYIHRLTTYHLDRSAPPSNCALNSRPGYLPKEISVSLISLTFLLPNAFNNSSRALSRNS